MPVVSRESLLLYWTTEIRTNRVQGMEMQILPLVLVLTGCLVGIRSVAIRSLAVSPHFPQRREVRGNLCDS